MGIEDDLNLQVREILRAQWETREGRVVPAPESTRQTNDAVKLEGVVLYADMASSTALVQAWQPWFAAAMYKVFLRCCARIVRSEEGTITSYDGDRIMAVFIGAAKSTQAARCALKINHAVKRVINPAVAERFPQSPYEMGHSVGVDTSPLFVANAGIRGDNDLVWVGRSANWAAKLSDLPPSHPSRITRDVYDTMADVVKNSSDGRPMWEATTWNGNRIFQSNWIWRP